MSLSLISSQVPYSCSQYWIDRYQTHQFVFDWIETFDSLSPYLTQIFSSFNRDISSLSLLHIGCGTSELSEKIYNTYNIKSITNIDASPCAIKFMYERTRQYPEMTWLVMDAKSMPFQKEKFDVVIDKCVSDALYCSKHPLNDIAIYYREVNRVLKNEGVFIVISYQEERIEQLKKSHLCFDVQCVTIENSIEEENGNMLKKVSKMYICKKKSKCNEEEFNVYLEEVRNKEQRTQEDIDLISN